MYTGFQVCEYAFIQFASMQANKYVWMQVGSCTSSQVRNTSSLASTAGIQVYMQAGIQVCKYASVQGIDNICM